MDIVFTCPACRQELEVDETGSGTEIECPECGASVLIPEPSPVNIRVQPPGGPVAAAATKEKHFKLPTGGAKSKISIERPRASLESEVKGVGKKLKIKCFRRADFIGQGPDSFDQAVSHFLQATDEVNIHSLTPIHYSYVDAKSGQVLTDYGVMVFYKG
ncbi:MAG: hypothetical protein HY301_02090 [Verrucomicrobia bacterium]|nr:hypothetical protein [Verrucomicrobiota bacterium]